MSDQLLIVVEGYSQSFLEHPRKFYRTVAKAHNVLKQGGPNRGQRCNFL